jgi:outer membrane lipoprotein-sorting protein
MRIAAFLMVVAMVAVVVIVSGCVQMQEQPEADAVKKPNVTVEEFIDELENISSTMNSISDSLES